VTRLRQVTWVIPVALGALAVALVVAVLVAREKSQQPAASVAPSSSTLEYASPGLTTAAVGGEVTYGLGLTHIVPSPVTSLTSILGNEWRELGQSIGRALIRPGGTPSSYFELSAVAVAQKSAARLEILTSEGERGIEPVIPGPYQVMSFGPLLAPKRGRIGVALTSVQLKSSSPGPSLILSHLGAEYLTTGQWVTGMPTLASVGPGGVRGLYLNSGTTARFAMTPGIVGRCTVILRGKGNGSTVKVTVTDGNQVHSALVRSHLGVVDIGPFSHTSSSLLVTVSAPTARSGGPLFVADMRFASTQQGAPRP
jgi:hypothetical protein